MQRKKAVEHNKLKAYCKILGYYKLNQNYEACWSFMDVTQKPNETLRLKVQRFANRKL